MGGGGGSRPGGGTNPSTPGAPGGATPPAAPPQQLAPPLPQPSPALGPLPSNAWAGHISAARGGGGGGSGAASAPAQPWVAVANASAAQPPPELPPLDLPPGAAPSAPATARARGKSGGGGGAAAAGTPARSPISSIPRSPAGARSPVSSLSSLALQQRGMDVWEARAPAMLALALAAAGLHGEGATGSGEAGLAVTQMRLRRLGLLGGASQLRGSALTLGELVAGARAAGEALGRAAAAACGGEAPTVSIQAASTALLKLGGDWSRLLANEAVRRAVWVAAQECGGGAGGARGAGGRLALALAGLHRRGVLRARCVRLGIARMCEDLVLPVLGAGRVGALKMAPAEERAKVAELLPHVIGTLAAVSGGAALGGRDFFPGALPEALAGELEGEEEEGGEEGALAAVVRRTAERTAEEARRAADLAVP